MDNLSDTFAEIYRHAIRAQQEAENARIAAQDAIEYARLLTGLDANQPSRQSADRSSLS